MIITPESNCNLCFQNITNFSPLITQSLFGKYSSSQNFYYTKQVNEILEEAISPAYINFQDNNYYDNQQEYMKRQYNQEEFPKKIEMLSQYYKFHRDLPVWNQRSIQSIMQRYYNRLKDVDYKKIKSILKKQQGISLTTHKSFSSLQDSEYTVKSRYSTMLNDLEVSNDSVMLKILCDKIGKAFKKFKPQINFKGTYYSGEKKFEQFLKKQKNRKQNQKIEDDENKNKKLGLKKLKFNHKLTTKDDQTPCLKEINFTSNHSLKQRKYPIKSTISIEKTTANQTISRQQKVRRQRSKSNFQVTVSRNSLSRKNSTARNPMIQQLFYPSKMLKGENILMKINNERKKTVKQIYKAIQKPEKIQKILEQPVKKSSAKQFVERLKTRSKSQSHLPTTITKMTLTRDLSKNKLDTNINLKTSMSQSKKNLHTNSISQKGSTQLKNNKKLLEVTKQDCHKIVRTSSTKNFMSQNIKQYKTNNFSTQANKTKQKCGIQQILQKKLNVFKRKQAVL